MRNDAPRDVRSEHRTEEIEVRVPSQRDGVLRDDRDHDATLGELFRRLTGDTTELLRAELELAKAEARETGSRLAKDVGRIGIAASLALVGTLALAGFLIIGLGMLLDERYWLSSLIVGVAAAGLGYVLLQSALRDVREHGVMPKQALESLRADVEWAKDEAREVKRELTSPPAS